MHFYLLDFMNKSQTHGRLKTAALATALSCDREAEDTEGSSADSEREILPRGGGVGGMNAGRGKNFWLWGGIYFTTFIKYHTEVKFNLRFLQNDENLTATLKRNVY